VITLTGSEKFSKKELEALVDKIKAIVYARVSTDMQVDNYSLETQVERCSELAFQKGIKEEEIVVLVEDGESGDNPNRPMINYAIFLLEYGIGDHIIFLHPNRMSRFLNLQTQLSNRIWALGKDFWFVEFDFDKSNPESMLNFNIQGSIAEYNKQKILADTKRGRVAKVKSGLIPGMNRLYGYTYDKELDTLVVNEEEKEVYLKIVDMFLNKNYSCSKIARELSLRNIRPAISDRWYQVTISRMLKNESYTGNYYYGKTKVVNYPDGTKKQEPQPREEWRTIPIPAYITMETYDKIMARMKGLAKRQSGRPTDDYLLRGMVKCGRCGNVATSGVTSKTNTRLIKYYTCTKKAVKFYHVGTGEHDTVCKGRNWRVDIVDKYVWDYVISIINNPKEFIEKLLEKQTDTHQVDDLLKQKNKLASILKEKQIARDRYTEMYVAGIIKSLKDVEDKVLAVDKQIEDIKEEMNELEQSLSAVLHESNDVDLIQDTLQKLQKIDLESMDIKDKRQIVQLFVKKVVLHENSKVDVYMHFSKDIILDLDSGKKHKNVIPSQVYGRLPQSIYTHLSGLL